MNPSYHILWGAWGRQPALLLAALLSACITPTGQTSPREPVAQPPLPAVNLCLRDGQKSATVRAEQATTNEQHRRGLMGRYHLPPNAGMLFLYEQPQSPHASFWMYNTRLPLDIAYLGPEGDIRAIRRMEPCLDSPANCPGYPAGVTYRAALEVNRGFFERHDIGVGGSVKAAAPEVCTGGASEPAEGPVSVSE